MMRKLLFFTALFFVLQANAQDYLISFEGTGDVKNLSYVGVDNLAKGTSLILSGSDVLHLLEIIPAATVDDRLIPGIKIYPNPMIESSVIEIYPPVPGNAIVTIYDLSGRQVSRLKSYFDNSVQEFKLSGPGKGLYIVNVRGDNYQFSGKIICNREFSGTIRLEKISSNQTIDVKEIKTYNATQGIVEMNYSPGERLMFTAISGSNRTTITDIPDETKTIVFDLISVADKDSNNYHVVKIGDQSWMEENLRTTRFSDGTSIPLGGGNAEWMNLTTPGYSWYSQSKEAYENPYGALYNGYSVGTGKLCPTGWHVPTAEEWNSMNDYLTINDYGYMGDQGATAKSLASKTGWEIPLPLLYQGNLIPVPDREVGKDQQNNNSSGFNGFAAGMRNPEGSFTGSGYKSVWYSSDGTSTLADFSISNNTSNIKQGYDYRSAGFSVRCIKGETKTLPNLITRNAYDITQTSATTGATIAGEGEAPVTSRGVCWNTTGNYSPTIDDKKTSDGTGLTSFKSLMTGLLPGEVYYVRSYAINSDGIAYGNLEVFTTKIADSDGNIYNTILLKDKIWMTENLKTASFSDGTTIPLVVDNNAWLTLSSPGFCYYNNDEITNKASYGGLYNWFAVNTGKLCPSDWHVASDQEWTDFTSFMAGEIIAGGRLKETGTEHWLSPNTGATDEKGFTALPGGRRDNNGIYDQLGLDGNWWSSAESDMKESWYRNMNYNMEAVSRNHQSKTNGLSVRCIKNAN
jgi:uncharacterized protein (TIGR02145 family)